MSWVAEASPVGRMTLMLDEVMDRLMAEPTEKDKGEALGLAKAIDQCCFLTVDGVREYALHRWEARQSGEEPLGMLEWAGLR